MKCWICGVNEADSGEHSIKKTDLKSLYPSVSQASPIYHRRNGEGKRPLGSIKAKGFKYENVICGDCNNTKTQPFDNDWEKLSKYLTDNWLKVKHRKGFKICSAFPNHTGIEMINVQLFFVKLLGCKIVESKAPIDLLSFSKAILEKKEHSDIYISFRDSEKNGKGNYSANSDIELDKDNENIIYAHWFYIIGDIAIDVIFSPQAAEIDLNGALKPSMMECFIPLSHLNYDQEYNDS